jgi:HAMP domain-containing protein
MILLDSVEILAAVRRSLEAHVLPDLRNDFARVQVQSALKALAEVEDRLEKGEPCERMNRKIETGVRELADSVRSESPGFAESLETALGAAAPGATPREHACQVGEALWRLASESEDPAAARLWALLRDESLRANAEDGLWMCGEAFESLT